MAMGMLFLPEEMSSLSEYVSRNISCLLSFLQNIGKAEGTDNQGRGKLDTAEKVKQIIQVKS